MNFLRLSEVRKLARDFERLFLVSGHKLGSRQHVVPQFMQPEQAIKDFEAGCVVRVGQMGPIFFEREFRNLQLPNSGISTSNDGIGNFKAL